MGWIQKNYYSSFLDPHHFPIYSIAKCQLVLMVLLVDYLFSVPNCFLLGFVADNAAQTALRSRAVLLTTPAAIPDTSSEHCCQWGCLV